VREAGGDEDRAAIVGAPTIVTAAAATIAGFLVLLLSPVPMVRGFGLLLVVGIVIALAVALLAGTAALALTAVEPRCRASGRSGAASAAVRGAGELVRPAGDAVAQALRPVGRRIGGAVAPRVGALARGAVSGAQRHPVRVLAVGAAIAVAGWGLDTQTRVESDIQKLVPQNLGAVQDLRALQRSTGVGGQLDVVVEAQDVADPKVITWMSTYQRGLLERYGYSAERGCGRADLCPAFSLPDLFQREPKDKKAVRELLDAVPPYFSQSGHHARPHDGDAVVRHQAAAARAPAGGHRDDARRARPARRRDGRARRPARAAAEANARVSVGLGGACSLLIAGLLAVFCRPARRAAQHPRAP
jgi:hypothetical protein